MLGEGLRVLQRGQRLVEAQLLVGECLPKLCMEQAPEQSGQHAHGQKEARLAGDPALAIGRHSTAGHDTVQVRVMLQSLAPGVQSGDEADLSAQVLRIHGDGAKGLGRGAEQDVVDGSLVLIGDGGDLLRQGEDDVEVFDRQQLGRPILQPLSAHERLALRAMPFAAAVERNALMTAGIPLLDVATQRRRAAAPGGSHDTALPMAERVSVIVTIRKPDLAEDVRHLEPLGAHFDPQK